VAKREALWEAHGEAWRDPVAVLGDWEAPANTDPDLLRSRVRGSFWEMLERARITLVLSREYEHLLVALAAQSGRPQITYLPVPHPSGVAFDSARGLVSVASTRNPNRVLDFAPATAALPRADSDPPDLEGAPLVPQRTRFYPGALYMHDLAVLGGELHANAVGENAVVRLSSEGGFNRVWWPKAIEQRGRPDFSRNHIQLNSIAAGGTLEDSYFTASSAEIGRFRPGHRRFPVDRRGAVFSGATREPVARGLTRPHSARLRNRGGRGQELWVLDSGYGGLCLVQDGIVETVARLPGWTRGLGLRGGIAFVATSRVIPRFAGYAPGLDIDRSVCGVHAVELASGRTLGSLVWPNGNQIFAVEPIPRGFSLGFPLPAGQRRPTQRVRRLFYAYLPPKEPE
jgi:uncharacterized protein (TIGR03032 family)